MRHTKMAVDNASKVGVECIGIGICDSTVSKLYDDHIVVNDINELAGQAFQKLTKTLLG